MDGKLLVHFGAHVLGFEPRAHGLRAISTTLRVPNKRKDGRGGGGGAKQRT